MLFCVAFSATGAQTCGVLWQWSAPSPTPYDLTAVAPCGTGFVAVGAYGMVLSSPDGKSWQRKAADGVLVETLKGVAQGPSGLVAVGDAGSVLFSCDGDNWITERPSPSSISFSCVAAVGSKYLAAGDQGRIFTSEDGQTWAQCQTGTMESFTGLAYGVGRYVAVGWFGGVVTSADAVTWANASQVPAGLALRGLAYGTVAGQPLFVAGAGEGSVLTSSDGLLWSVRSTGLAQSFTAVSFDGSRFLACGYGGMIAQSTDGATWTAMTTGTPRLLLGLASGENGYLAVGTYGTILNSPDALQWTQTNAAYQGGWLHGVATDGSRWVSVGDMGVILTSPDGTATWASATSGVQANLTCAAYGGGTFLVGGSSGTLLASGDGTHWSRRTLGFTTDVLGVAYLGGQFWLVGRGGLIASSSSGGASWIVHNSTVAEDLCDITFGAGRYVAVGQSGTIVTSTDGNQWQASSTGDFADLQHVIFAGGRFVLAGYGIRTSTDGLRWELRGVSGANAVAYAGGLYIAAATGETQTSADAVDWASRLDFGDGSVNALASSGELVVAVGYQGIMAARPRPIVTTVVPSFGPSTGGTEVTLLGSGFGPVASVSFGAQDAPASLVISDSSMRATSPSRSSAGRVTITVGTGEGRSLPGASAQYAFVGLPSISGVSPPEGVDSGGWPVTIRGHNFTAATSVKFGDAEAMLSEISDAEISTLSPGHPAGTVDVTVVTPGGTSLPSSGARFTYYPTPWVSDLSPAGGPLSGGTAVVLKGGGLTGVIEVTFDETPSPSFTVDTDGQITAASPPHEPGDVTVWVKNGHGLRSATPVPFTYVSPPVLAALSPSRGPTGGTSVTITGSDLYTTSAVWFGDQQGRITWNMDDRLIVTSPPRLAGTVDVVIHTLGGQTLIGPSSKFEYFAPVPSVTELRPSSGASAGGNSVSIMGSGFQFPTSVLFGNLEAASYEFVHDGLIVAKTPPHAPGVVNVSVTTAGGTSPAEDVNKFAYSDVLPTVTEVSPASGTILGSSGVKLTGSGFMHTVDVLFGTRSAIDHMTLSDTSMVVAEPAHSAGTVDVTVVSTFGSSLPSDKSKYTYCDCGVRWEWVNPVPKPTPLYCVAASDSRLVAVGPAAPVLTSEDGLTWLPRHAGIPPDVGLNAVVWGAGRFVAVGPRGAIFSSPDGLEWEEEYSGVRNFILISVSYGGGLFVAVGEYGTILTSPDGRAWTMQTVSSDLFYRVAYGAGHFVVTGLDGDIYMSEDGASWSHTFSDRTTHFYGLGFGSPGGRPLFVVSTEGGKILTSPDGAAWTVHDEDSQDVFGCIAFDGTRFVGVSSTGRVGFSADGVSWSMNALSQLPLAGLAFHSGDAVVVGEGGEIFISHDEASWTKVNRSMGTWKLNNVVSGSGQVVAVGDGGAVVRSSDGSEWITGESGMHSDLLSVAFGNGRFVAGGAGGALITSADGIAWSMANGATSSQIEGVRYLNGAFWAVGEGGAILSSPDGEHWTVHDAGTTSILRDIAYGSGRFIVVGDLPKLLTSQDGRMWTTISGSPPDEFAHVVFAGDQFLASRIDVWSSKDGKTWTKPSEIQPQVWGISYLAGLYSGTSDGRYLSASPDGAIWSACSEGPGLSSTAAWDWGFIAVGNGRIMRGRPDPTVMTLTPNHGSTDGGTQVTLSGRGFERGSRVLFGDAPAADVVVASGTQISCIAPPHAAGAIDVSVVRADGVCTRVQNAFQYGAPPVIQSVSALKNPLRLKVSGTRFLKGCSVMIDGEPAPGTTFKSATQLIVKGGATLAGMLPKGTPVQITVVNPAGAGISAPYPFTR